MAMLQLRNIHKTFNAGSVNEYQDNIKQAIEDKLNGKAIKKGKKKQKQQVSDLLEALEKSLKK